MRMVPSQPPASRYDHQSKRPEMKGESGVEIGSQCDEISPSLFPLFPPRVEERNPEGNLKNSLYRSSLSRHSSPFLSKSCHPKWSRTDSPETETDIDMEIDLRPEKSRHGYEQVLNQD